MKKNSDVHVLYKNLGETPLQCLERFKRDNTEYANVPMTYAGRLDPMAEGLLLVLSHDAVYEKGKYTGLSKTYVFEMLWGFETDTLDVLGMVLTDKTFKVPSVEEIRNILQKSVGKFSQKYPQFSSKNFQGSYESVRNGGGDEKYHDVEIRRVDFISRRTMSATDLLSHIIEKIAFVSGDFRQEEIKVEWKKVLKKQIEKEFTIDTLEISVSSGFYVRQFVSDIANRLVVKATTFHIVRKMVGDFII